MAAALPRASDTQQRVRAFHFALAIACLLLAFTGFLPTYWAPLAQRALHVDPIVHIHALFFFGWTVFLVAQAYLTVHGQLQRHRAFGVAGVALATAMVFTGVLMTIHSLKHDVPIDAVTAKAFSIVSFSGIVFFAIVVALALANVRNPEMHRRLMLLATISIVQAPVARWFLVAFRPPDAIGAPPVAVTIPAALVIDLLIVAAIVYDAHTRGRPHRVWVIGGGCLLALQLLRLPLSTTAGWTAVADALLALAP